MIEVSVFPQLRKLLAYGNYKVFTEKECSVGSGGGGEGGAQSKTLWQ